MRADANGLPTYDELMVRQRMLMSLRKSRGQDHRVFVTVDKVRVLMALQEELV